MVRLIKNTLINDLVLARKRQMMKSLSGSVSDDSHMYKYVMLSVLPFIASHAHLLKNSGWDTMK
jgi:hypothetical protein